MRVNQDEENKLKRQGYEYVIGLEPVIFKGVKTLILGSLPGKQSLESKEYYAKKGNKFWPLLEDIFQCGKLKTYEEKKALLKQHNIALWDIYHNGYRKGSKDDFKYTTTNDIVSLLKQYPTIQQIAVAGKNAQKCFFSEFNFSNTNVKIKCVTSTSGGNGHFKKQKHTWYELFK